MELSKDGNKIKLVSIATNKVKETKTPKAWVPPNSEAVKIENPKNTKGSPLADDEKSIPDFEETQNLKFL